MGFLIFFTFLSRSLGKCFTYNNISWFLVLESFANYLQTSGNRRIFFKYYYNRDFNRYSIADTTFDVTMGSFDGVELCELIGIYIESLLTNILSKDNMGIYRDDRLFILRKINKQQTDRVQKKIISIFKNIDFKTEIITNLTEVDFLDVTFMYRPYKKPSDKLIYIDVS